MECDSIGMWDTQFLPTIQETSWLAKGVLCFGFPILKQNL